MGPPLLLTAANRVLSAGLILSTLFITESSGAGGRGSSSGGQSQAAQAPIDFDCPEEFGYYAHPTDCTLYYVCVFGGALLESCTGGLMYSHELQTCDWPRNVGCAPGQQQIRSQPQQQHITQKISQQPVQQSVDTSSSRGRQRPQQIQIPKADLYTEEEDLGPAEELESDRQQRVYRGQPSTLGQVASDRDGLSTHSNAIPVPSTGGRDKLSVVSYGAQQQYNSKNRRRQTNGVDNSDHNFLTNISRVRKKRDNTNSNRRSPETPTRRKKRRDQRNQRQDGDNPNNDSKKSGTRRATSSQMMVKSVTSKKTDEDIPDAEDEEEVEGNGNNDEEYDRSLEEDEEGDHDKRRDSRQHDEDEEGDNGKIRDSRQHDEDEEVDKQINEDYDEESDDEENGEDHEEKEKDDIENLKSKENTASEEFNFDDDSKEKNSSSEDFKVDFPDPPSSWDSFEDFKFPFDDVDIDFDKFLEDLKNDKFDDFDVYVKSKNGPSSTTVYPTSIFNFYSNPTFTPYVQSSTPAAVKFDFYFPHFNNNRNKSNQGNDQKDISYNEYKFSEENKHSGENKLSSLSENLPWESTKVPTSTIVSPVDKTAFADSTKPAESTSTLRRNSISSDRAQVAEDRMGNIDDEKHKRNNFANGKSAQFAFRTQFPSRLNDTIAAIRNKWSTVAGKSGSPINLNRGTAKFTFLTTPLVAGSTTPKYLDNPQQTTPLISSGSFQRRTTEQSNIPLVAPKFNVQSTKPTIFDKANEFPVSYSTHYDSRFDNPKNRPTLKYDNIIFTTPNPSMDLASEAFLRRSTESLRNSPLSPTFTSVPGKDQHVVSYSYPSVTFQESRGPPNKGKPHTFDGQFGKPVYAIPVSQTNIRQGKSNFNHANQKIPGHIKFALRQGPHLNNKRPTASVANRNNKFLPSPTRQGGHIPARYHPKRQHPRNFGPSGGVRNNKNFANNFNRLNNKPQNIRQIISLKNNQQSIDETNSDYENEKEEEGQNQNNKNQVENGSQEEREALQNDEGIQKSTYKVQEENPENVYNPNSTSFINNRLHTFAYVNIHDNEQSNTERTPLDQEITTSSTTRLIGGFQPSISWNSHIETTPGYKLGTNENDTLGVIDLPIQKLSTMKDKPKSNPPAGSYVFFSSNIGSTVAVPVEANNLYPNHKGNSEDNYNDYYNEYDEGDYNDVNKTKTSASKPPSVPKTLQNIEYQEYDEPEYEEYNGDDKDYDDEGYDDESSNGNRGKQSNSNDEEYYDDEEESEEDGEGEGGEPSIERPKTVMASSTTKAVGCVPRGANSKPGQGTNLCPSEKPTDRPTTTADEQNNSEQTRRTITLLRASVQPIQQQVYDPRGYNTSRYIQQQQYDPNYYTVYDEEAEQYKDIADYAAQYVQQKQQDSYARKKPSVEIIQQEQIQRGSPYTKTKYSNQQDNIYQSVTPQEYDSYSIQTNDDIPYRQVQTKSNNRFPEVKESESTQGERRLITLSAKFSHGGPAQTNSQTNTDRDSGKSRSEVTTEANVVNITPRKDNRVSPSDASPAATRSNGMPSFAQEINSLAQAGAVEDPVAKVLEALTKSEEFLSDEASTESSVENRNVDNSRESIKPLTVEEVDIDYLRRLNSQTTSSEGSLNRFRFTPRKEEKTTTERNVISHYRIGLSPAQPTPTSNNNLLPSSQQGIRQAKLIHEEITTPRPLILQLQDDFNIGLASFEKNVQQLRSRQESSSDEFRGRNDASSLRSRGSMRRNPSEQSNDQDKVRSEPILNRQQNLNVETQRNAEQPPVRTGYTPTQSPLRITVAPLTNANTKEHILKHNNANNANNKKHLEEEEPFRNSPVTSNNENSRGRPAIIRNFANPPNEGRQTSTANANNDPSKQVVIRMPENKSESKPIQRERLMPLSDYVNSNVNTMIQVNRNLRPVSIEEDKSIEEQMSEEARKPIAIRIPETYNQQRNEDKRQFIDSRQYEKEDKSYSRKPIRYSDSLEYKEHQRNEGTRGSSRFIPSAGSEYANGDLINVTEEPQKPIAIRIPQRIDSVPYHSREQAQQTDRSNNEQPSRNLPSHEEPRQYQKQEERRRIVSSPVQPAQDQNEYAEPEVSKPIAIRVPDSIDLNHYRSREQSTAAKVADSLGPMRTRGRIEEDDRETNDYRTRSKTDEETRQRNDYRTRSRVPSSSQEETRSDDLRNRYEVATTLRPTRVFSIPTTTKPTRPPKKFRNGTQYSDLTLPIGTDETVTNQPEPDPSIRVRPMSFNVPTTPGLTRGNSRHRGSHTYTVSPNEAEPAAAPRGTSPPQRSRPTLKPSTTVVGKATEYQDIYRFPASRPENVYPTPQVDKTAAKCRKDVCLLPDCYCGGKDIPGELTPEETPQIVLLTFDDSVNDLNKGLYSDLFEKGRVNPNGCPISATFYVSHEWTDYSQVQNLYAGGHEIASHSVSHSFGEQFSQRKWTREIGGQREILAAYGGVKLEDIRGMRAPFLAVGGNKMFKMLYDSNFTYDSSMPVYENRPPSWPYTLDYKVFHDCMIPPCPTKSYPGVWEVPMVMWQDLNGGRCSMGDACSNPPNAEGVYKMLIKNFERHFTSNRAPFGLFYHAAWFTQPHHKEGFIAFLDTINKMPEVWLISNWQAIQWVRDPTPLSRLGNFAPFQCNYHDRPKKCNNPRVCNLWHKSGVRYMRTCQACPEVYPWTGKSGVRNSRIDNEE